jgi:Rrf2 family protein
MKLSSKGEYGVLALIDIALHEQNRPLQLNQIAKDQSIPKQYLDQLMLSLKKAGLVRSVRGPHGGYSLARPANTITLLDIVNILEGPVENVNFLDNGSEQLRSLLKDIWDGLSEHTDSVLRNTTVLDICAKYQATKPKPMYNI